MASSLSFVIHSLPSGIIGSHLSFAVSSGIVLAAREPDDEVPFLVCAINSCSRRVLAVSAQDSLRDQRQFSQDCRMPLNDMILQREQC